MPAPTINLRGTYMPHICFLNYYLVKIFLILISALVLRAKRIQFSGQEYWSGLPFPSPGDLPDPGIETGSQTLQADALPSV